MGFSYRHHTKNTVCTTSTDTRAQHYVEIVSLSIRSYSLGATHCVAYNLYVRAMIYIMHGVSARLWHGRGVVELKTHAAQLGWNTCNPSLLSGFAFCWHINLNAHRFSFHLHGCTHTPMNQHIHTSNVTLIHTLSPTILFPLLYTL